MSDAKIPIPRALYDLLTAQAEEKGYSSTEEYIVHVLETTVADAGPGASEEEIRERLRGLGYLA